MLFCSVSSEIAFGGVVSAGACDSALAVSSTVLEPLSSACSSWAAFNSWPADSDGASATGADVEPSEAMLIRVVVASAGSDLPETPPFFVSWREGFLIFEESGRTVDGREVFEAKFFATDMLSRATSVTGAALDIPDQAPGYQL